MVQKERLFGNVDGLNIRQKKRRLETSVNITSRLISIKYFSCLLADLVLSPCAARGQTAFYYSQGRDPVMACSHISRNFGVGGLHACIATDHALRSYL